VTREFCRTAQSRKRREEKRSVTLCINKEWSVLSGEIDLLFILWFVEIVTMLLLCFQRRCMSINASWLRSEGTSFFEIKIGVEIWQLS